MNRSDLIMELLLKYRHLAPSFTSTQQMPNIKKDPMLIDIVPDFFITGHIHTAIHHQYKKTTCLNCSAWCKETEYQKKIGLKPDPCKIFLVNLKTREVKVKSFL